MTEKAPKTSSRGTKSQKDLASTSTDTQRYQAAYERLSAIAAELESGQTDLDRALPLLTQAQAAYAICQERIARLQTLLDQASLDQTSAPASLADLEAAQDDDLD